MIRRMFSIARFHSKNFIFVLLIPAFAQAACHKIYSSSGELVYSSVELPFPYPVSPESISSTLKKFIPNGHLVTGNSSPCPFIDKVTPAGKAKAEEIENRDREFRENREKSKREAENAVEERENRERQRKIAEKLEEEKRKQNPELAQEFNERVARLKAQCGSMLRSVPAWKDRDALKIGNISRDGFRTLSDRRNSNVFVQYSTIVNGKNSYGAYAGEKLAFCYSDEFETKIVKVEVWD